MGFPNMETAVSIAATIASVILMGILVYLTRKQQKLQHMQYELQERVFLRKQAAFLVPYLVLIREVVSEHGESVYGPSAITNIMIRPECPEAEGTLGLYLTYLRNTMGGDAEKELLNIFNTIHEYAVRREALPLNVKSDLITKLNNLINNIINKYAVEPKALHPEKCLENHLRTDVVTDILT